MRKAEMLVYLDSALDLIRQRGLVSTGITKSKLRQDYKALLEVRAAIDKHVPGASAPAYQPSLF